ncbi:MAG: 3'-5' exonuclease [Lachnospiraceae bacterium]|nr:3'-5' exonuclease [Lachnospiraceae bacterium]
MLNSYILLDLETTGLSAKEDAIIEIGALKVVDGKIVDKIETFINPARKIPHRITEVTGINDEMVENAPYIAEVIADVVKFLQGFTIIGHNVMFDYSFLKRTAVNHKYTLETKVIDTLKISRQLLTDLPKKSLEYLCNHFGIKDENHHRAINDAYVAGELYKLLCNEYEENNPDVFEPKEAIYKVKKESPVTKKQAEWLKALVAYHNIQIDYDIDKLTKNSASRYIDKILATYGRCPK